MTMALRPGDEEGGERRTGAPPGEPKPAGGAPGPEGGDPDLDVTELDDGERLKEGFTGQER